MKGVDYCMSKLSVFLADLLIYQQYVNTAPCVHIFTQLNCVKKMFCCLHMFLCPS